MVSRAFLIGTMDTSTFKALQDKLYDRRKAGALEYVADLFPRCSLHLKTA